MFPSETSSFDKEVAFVLTALQKETLVFNQVYQRVIYLSKTKTIPY